MGKVFAFCILHTYQRHFIYLNFHESNIPPIFRFYIWAKRAYVLFILLHYITKLLH